MVEFTAGLKKLINPFVKQDWYSSFLVVADLILSDAPDIVKTSQHDNRNTNFGRQVIFFQDNEMKRPVYEMEVIAELAYHLCSMCWYAREQAKTESNDKEFLEQSSNADRIISDYLCKSLIHFEIACTTYIKLSQEFDFTIYTEANLFNKVYRYGSTILALTSTKDWTTRNIKENITDKLIDNVTATTTIHNSSTLLQHSLKQPDFYDSGVPLDYKFENLQVIINDLRKTQLLHYSLLQPIFDRVNYMCENYIRKG